MIDRLTLYCCAASACFLAILPLELRSEIGKPLAPPLPIIKPDEALTKDDDGRAIRQQVATALARPLFSVNRRPPEVETDAREDNSLSDLRLTGILIMPDQHVAIFAKPDGKPLVRSEGDMISEWHIDSIVAQSIFLSGPSGTATLEPKADPRLNRLQLAAQPMMPAPQPAVAAANPPPAQAANTPVRPAPVLRSAR
jgi:hypothetical protein